MFEFIIYVFISMMILVATNQPDANITNVSAPIAERQIKAGDTMSSDYFLKITLTQEVIK